MIPMCQPRATPWVHQPKTPSALKARFIPEKSVVPTAVFRLDSHEIAGFDQFCLALLSSLRKL